MSTRRREEHIFARLSEGNDDGYTQGRKRREQHRRAHEETNKITTGRGADEILTTRTCKVKESRPPGSKQRHTDAHGRHGKSRTLQLITKDDAQSRKSKDEKDLKLGKPAGLKSHRPRRAVIVHVATSDSESESGTDRQSSCLSRKDESKCTSTCSLLITQMPHNEAQSPCLIARNEEFTGQKDNSVADVVQKSSSHRQGEYRSSRPPSTRRGSSFFAQLARSAFAGPGRSRSSLDVNVKTSSRTHAADEWGATSPSKRLTLARSASTSQAPSTAGWYRPKAQHRHSVSSVPAASACAPPTERATCVACLEDFDHVLRPGASAKFECGHSMCKTCLQQLFELATTDPQHMPPKCCAEATIPITYIEGLFSPRFQKMFNQKLKEYTTKNRIYCVKKDCGKWIMPRKIQMDERVGRRYGVCSCGTKVCQKCNMKWHGKIDCKHDPDTEKFIDMAKREGWQRCYSCKAWVELTEGCNHMSCRCKAQFCILCGSKWKTCDCPWFNTEAVDGALPFVAGGRLALARGQPPRGVDGYRAQLDARRRQEREDELMARQIMLDDWEHDNMAHLLDIEERLRLLMAGIDDATAGRRPGGVIPVRPLFPMPMPSATRPGRQGRMRRMPTSPPAPEPPVYNRASVDNQLLVQARGSLSGEREPSIAGSVSDAPSGFRTLRQERRMTVGAAGGDDPFGLVPLDRQRTDRGMEMHEEATAGLGAAEATTPAEASPAAMAGLVGRNARGRGRVGLWLQHVATAQPWMEDVP